MTTYHAACAECSAVFQYDPADLGEHLYACPLCGHELEAETGTAGLYVPCIHCDALGWTKQTEGSA